MKVSNAVDLIIVNKNNQILLAKRNSNELDYQGTRSIPGGGLEENENFEDALHREIQEELGCNIIRMRYFKSYALKLSEEHFARALYFYGEIDGNVTLNDELSEFKRFDLNDPALLDLGFAFNQKEVLKDFINYEKLNLK